MAKKDRYAIVYAPVIFDLENNVFCKEVCFLCKEMFDAGMSLYELKNFGYICYDCAGKLELVGVPTMEEIKKIQDRKYREMFGKDFMKRMEKNKEKKNESTRHKKNN